jgi:replicative DNA helicase
MTAVARIDRYGEPEPPAPPENLEAEQVVLGALLADNRAFDRVATLVAADDFASPAHGRIFDACRALIEKGQRASAITLKGRFERDEELQADGGGALYLARLQGGAMPSMLVDSARIVRDCRVRRDLLAAAQDLAARATDFAQPDAAGIAEEAARLLGDIGAAAARDGATGPRGLQDIGQSTLDQIEDAMRRRAKGGLSGITTGLPRLDEALDSMQPGQLIVIGGRPAMGKSSLAEGIGWANARAGLAGIFFSYEMRAEELVQREIGRRTQATLRQMRSGHLRDEAFGWVLDETRRLQQLPLRIDNRSQARLAPVLAHCRQAKRKGQLAYVIIDYLQLMQGEVQAGRRDRNRAEEISDITRGLKRMANDLGVPVILLSQLNRSFADRDNRRPRLEDLRESGAIEQDADVVLFVHREHYYLERDEPSRRGNESAEKFSERYAQWQDAMAKTEGKAEIIVAKHRHGEAVTVHLEWDGPRVNFVDPDAPRGVPGENGGLFG